MPIYEYVCDKCGKLNDVLQKMNDPPPERCAACGTKGKLTKVVSRSSFVLRGGGWYSDLYSSAKKDSKSETSKEGDNAPPKADATSNETAKPATSTDSSGASSGSKKEVSGTKAADSGAKSASSTKSADSRAKPARSSTKRK
jgi:putative FmdB family regulatory protein